MSVTKGNIVKKKAMIEALTASLGVASTACKEVGIARKTHYGWMKTDKNYRQDVEDIVNVSLDFVESALFQNVRKGDTTSIIFYLKTKGKHRGYIEKQEIEHSGTAINITVEKKAKKGTNYLTGETNSEAERNISST